MSSAELDRGRLRIAPLAQRTNKLRADRDMIGPNTPPRSLSDHGRAVVAESAERMRQARAAGRPVMLAFGAHTINNGLGPVLIHLLEQGWVQHLATNGAGVIHDWEFAFQGETSEDVRANVAAGTFGLWQETGFHINLALTLGACDGLGYGESVGRLIERESHQVPDRAELLAVIAAAGESAESATRAAAAADLLAVLEQFDLPSGTMHVPHPWKRCSVQAAAFRAAIPFTGHPMFGHDIIYTHPLSRGAAIGRTAERDFLRFAHSVAQLDGGVYLSVGSAVMSPMVFEKSLSMAQNLAIQRGQCIDRHFIVVVDLAESRWDWSQGEPPSESAEYYLRYCKTFSRMGGDMRYVSADNRDFLLALCNELGGAG